MADVVQIDLDKIYQAWREHLLANSDARHFGMFNDKSVADFPYANLMKIGSPTDATDLENNEATVDLTFQTDCYINNSDITALYVMDDACWVFFNELGFRKMGDSAPTVINNSDVKRLTSRFTLRNCNGRFLKEI